MKHLKLTFLILFALPLFSAGISNSETYVYICTGKTAYAYHKTDDCRGLKNCKGEIKTVTLAQAQQLNRKPCGYCYK